MDFDIRTYGGSKRGRSHEATGKPCQDSSHCGLLPDHPHIALLIVADGVGSAEHSDEGSRIAVDAVRSYLEGKEPPFTPETVREAYHHAWDAIDRHTEEGTGWPSDYDTTLSTAVFDAGSGRVVFGHSGDGAILAIGLNGVVESLTVPQKGAEANSVKPLRDHFAWEFGESEGPYVSVMAMTDGVLDLLMPGILKLSDNPIYVRLVSWLADFKFFEKKDVPIEESFAKRMSYIQSDIHKGMTNDDLTFIAAMNIRVSSEYRGDDYYREPDWKALNEEWKRRAYPSLYRDGSEPDEATSAGRDADGHKVGPDGAEAPEATDTIRNELLSKGIEALAMGRDMLEKGRCRLAALQFRSAAEEGNPTAIAYLDSSTLVSLDDPKEMERCLVIISLKDAVACRRMCEHWESKGDQERARAYRNKLSLMDPDAKALKGLTKRLDSLSSADRPR